MHMLARVERISIVVVGNLNPRGTLRCWLEWSATTMFSHSVLERRSTEVLCRVRVMIQLYFSDTIVVIRSNGALRLRFDSYQDA